MTKILGYITLKKEGKKSDMAFYFMFLNNISSKYVL